jgi:predicted dehydrogenase
MAEVGDIDNGIVSLTFADGQLGVVDCSRSAVYGYDIATEILGTQGTLRVGYLRETALLLMQKNQICHDVVPYFMERFEQAYIAQLNDFVEKLQGGQAPAVECQDGVASLRIGLAARRSLLEQREVMLDEPGL